MPKFLFGTLLQQQSKAVPPANGSKSTAVNVGCGSNGVFIITNF
jgi:hypothetical protein